MEEPEYIKELKERYRSTIEDKLSEFEALIQSYSTNRNEETLDAFRAAVHKLAGSAGSFGFVEVSACCKKMENRILEDKVHFFENDRTEEFKGFLNEIRSGFQEKKEVPPEPPVAPESAPSAPSEENPADVVEVPVAIQEISEAFGKNVGAQLEEIEKNIDALLIEPHEQKIWGIKDCIHRLAATAKGYNLLELGEVLKDLENLIQKDMHQWIEGKLSKSNVEEVRDKIAQVKAIYTNTPVETKEVVIQPDLFIFIDDPSFISQIQHEGSIRGIVVESEKDPAMVPSYFNNEKFNPIFLIIDETFLEIGGGVALIEKFRKSHPDGSVIGLILKESSLENRIQALKSGINYIFSYPLSIKSLLDLGESLAIGEQTGKFRIVVLDNNVDSCAEIKEMLISAEMETEVLYDSKNLFPILERTRPDLLILDAHLQDSNAIDLLKIIRRDAYFRELPVVLLTNENNEQGIEEALREGIETFVTKPVQKEGFVNRIAAIAKMHQGKRVSQEKDPETGFFQYSAFMQLMSRFLRKMGDEKDAHTLVLVGVAHFEDLQTNEQQFAQAMTLALANSISTHFRSVELKGRMRKGVFALLFENSKQADVKKNVEAFIKRFQDEPFLIYHKEKKVHLCAGLSTFPSDGMSSDELFKCAQEALYEAEAFESVPVLTFSKVGAEGAQIGEICVIDDDEDVRHLLKFAIEKEGYKIRVLKSFAEAVNYFEELKGKQLPRLVIFDRLLPDGDGMDLYRKLKAEVPNFPPALFLSTLSSEADVVEGLREGAIDYIIKPFALPILIEKLKRILE